MRSRFDLVPNDLTSCAHIPYAFHSRCEGRGVHPRRRFTNRPYVRPLQNPVIPAKAGIQRGWANGEPRLIRLGTAVIPSFAMVSYVGDSCRLACLSEPAIPLRIRTLKHPSSYPVSSALRPNPIRLVAGFRRRDVGSSRLHHLQGLQVRSRRRGLNPLPADRISIFVYMLSDL